MFRPERFLHRAGHEPEPDPDVAYGFGRRICPGQHVAQRSLFINIALIFWAFNVMGPIHTGAAHEDREKEKETGYDLDAWAKADRAVARPPAFRVRFEERIEGAVVRRTVDEMVSGGEA